MNYVGRLWKSRSTLLVRSRSVLGLGILLLSLGCSRQSENSSRVVINLPAGQSPQYSTMAVTPSAGWGVVDPTSISQFVCFAVTVSASDLTDSVCRTSANVDVMKFGMSSPLFKAGDKITVEVPSGSQRTIRIIGFAATSAEACAVP
jgi:hypothetical protein